MTREEALNILHNASVYHPDYLDALNMAIKALSEPTKTEPTTITENMTNGGMIKAMFPKDYAKIYDRSVSSWWNAQYKGNFTKPTKTEPKKGHWIMTSNYYTGAYETIDYVKCSCCGEESLEEGDFCPNCGAEMGSEDKE